MEIFNNASNLKFCTFCRIIVVTVNDINSNELQNIK